MPRPRQPTGRQPARKAAAPSPRTAAQGTAKQGTAKLRFADRSKNAPAASARGTAKQSFAVPDSDDASRGPLNHTDVNGFVHYNLPCGAEFAADVLPARQTVALVFRVLVGLADEPEELTGIGELVESTLSKGTQRFDGRGLADAFDRLGAHWSTASGRQSMVARVLCLPGFVDDAIDLIAEMLCRPTFPPDACAVAVDLAQQELRHKEDEPQDLLRVLIQRLTLGPVLGRHPGGTHESLARLTPALMRAQVAAAGPLDAARLAAKLESAFAGFGRSERDGRGAVPFEFTPGRVHQHKELEQQHIGITLPGVPRESPDYPVEQVLTGILAGGMSGRLFVEVREKLGLVYWVGAWHEEPRGKGILHLGASTTPERCHETYDTLLRELRRIGEDLTKAETVRARDALIAQYETEDDLTRARAASLSDDLFHFGRPIGLPAKLDALRAVTLDRVVNLARRLPVDQLCVATLGPRELG